MSLALSVDPTAAAVLPAGERGRQRDALVDHEVEHQDDDVRCVIS